MFAFILTKWPCFMLTNCLSSNRFSEVMFSRWSKESYPISSKMPEYCDSDASRKNSFISSIFSVCARYFEIGPKIFTVNDPEVPAVPWVLTLTNLLGPTKSAGPKMIQNFIGPWSHDDVVATRSSLRTSQKNWSDCVNLWTNQKSRIWIDPTL